MVQLYTFFLKLSPLQRKVYPYGTATDGLLYLSSKERYLYRGCESSIKVHLHSAKAEFSGFSMTPSGSDVAFAPILTNPKTCTHNFVLHLILTSSHFYSLAFMDNEHL